MRREATLCHRKLCDSLSLSFEVKNEAKRSSGALITSRRRKELVVGTGVPNKLVFYHEVSIYFVYFLLFTSSKSGNSGHQLSGSEDRGQKGEQIWAGF
jgi:hypothetical protein